MLKTFELFHHVEQGNHLFTAGSIWSNLNLLLGQITMFDFHSLLHGPLVKLFIVVDLADAFWLCLALEIQEWCDIVRQLLVVLNIAKDVEQLLIVVLSVFNLFRCVILQVTVSATLSWLVGLILLCPHGHDILDSLLDDSALNIVHA